MLGKNKRKKDCFTYTTVTRTLISRGVIECDSEKIYGQKSYGYKMTEKFYDNKPMDYELRSKKIIEKIETAQANKFNELPNYLKQMQRNLSEITDCSVEVGLKRISRSSTGRVFNFLTSSKRKVRHRFSWKNMEPLMDLDINGSQPYFLGLVVGEGLGFKEWEEEIPEDLNEYLFLCEDGCIYEFFADKLGKNIASAEARNKFKKEFYNSYFFNEKYNVMNNSDIGRVFKDYFPTIHNFIIKRFVNRKISLASQLQKRESSLVVDNVYRQLFEKGIWAGTLHDCIVCKLSDREIVKSVFQEALNQNITTAILKEKIWTDKSKMLSQENLKTDCGNTVVGIGTPSKEKNNWDTINSSFSNTNTNTTNRESISIILMPDYYVTYGVNSGKLASMVSPLNKKELLFEKKRTEIVGAIEQLIREDKPVTQYKVRLSTGIHKETVRKHWKDLQLFIELKQEELYQLRLAAQNLDWDVYYEGEHEWTYEENEALKELIEGNPGLLLAA